MRTISSIRTAAIVARAGTACCQRAKPRSPLSQAATREAFGPDAGRRLDAVAAGAALDGRPS